MGKAEICGRITEYLLGQIEFWWSATRQRKIFRYTAQNRSGCQRNVLVQRCKFEDH